MKEWDLTQAEIQKRLENMVWSFSRLNSANQCKYAWYLHYICGKKGVENGFAQFGIAVHETLEKFLKDEISIFEASEYYQEKFGEYVTSKFPYNKSSDLRENAFQEGLNYFNQLTFDLNKYEILGVENEIEFKIGGIYPAKGYIDLAFKDKDTGDIIISDHKTAKLKFLKDGVTLSRQKSEREHFLAFKRQLYLYSIAGKELWGKVDKLRWNLIRLNRDLVIPYNEEEFKEAEEWAIKTIEEVKNEIMWLPDVSETYFCNTLCDNRMDCTYRE